MLLKEYDISEVYISKLGYYSEEYNIFVYYPTYGFEFSIVLKKDNAWYVDLRNNSKFKSYKESNAEEKRRCILWGELTPIWSYLTAEEIEKGKITTSRINEIYCEINNICVLKPNTKEDNILTFKLKNPC